MSGYFKKIRNIAAVVLTAACVLTFSGCGDEEEEPVPTKMVTMTNEFNEIVTDEEGNPVETDVPLETIALTNEDGSPQTDESGNQLYEYEKLPEEEKTVYKVGFVYNGFVDDGATNGCFEVARAQLERSLGIETCYIENVLVSEFPEAVDTLQDEGCNIIVACSPKYSHSAAKEAKTSTSTYYLAFGGDSQAGAITSFGGELYQTAAVCGLAAAHNTKSNIIGVVADQGSYNVYGVVDAFVLGAADIWGTHTDVRVDFAWSNSHSEIEEAVDDLILKGCDIIMSYMESDYAIRYAATKGVKVIGNCYDIPEIAPDNYISGFFFNFSTVLVDQVRAIMNDNFSPSLYSGDIAAGMVRLVNFGLTSEKGTEDICGRFYEHLKNGADVFMGEIKDREGTIMVEKGQSMSFVNILKINWFVQGIPREGGIKNFAETIDNPVGSDFAVHKEFKKELLPKTGSQATTSADTTQPPTETAESEAQAELVE